MTLLNCIKTFIKREKDRRVAEEESLKKVDIHKYSHIIYACFFITWIRVLKKIIINVYIFEYA